MPQSYWDSTLYNQENIKLFSISYHIFESLKSLVIAKKKIEIITFFYLLRRITMLFVASVTKNACMHECLSPKPDVNDL